MPTFPALFQLPNLLRRKARRSRIWTVLALLTVLWVVFTPFYIIYKPPQAVVSYFQRRWPDVIFQVPTRTKTVALTFDDAPSPYTIDIAKILETYNASATFFIIGSQVTGKEWMLEDLVASSNELGNHAMFDQSSKALSDDVLADQIETVRGIIHTAYAAAGEDAPPDYFRPGGGLYTERMRRVLHELDYQLVLGSIYPHDPQVPFWRVNAKHILSMLRPGAIIVCHDRRSWTIPMLKMVLPEIARRGYSVVTLTELLAEGRTKEN